MNPSSHAQPDAAPDAVGDNPAAERQTILVVDDEPRNLQLLGNLLRNKGFGVRFASTGEQALESLEDSPSDLVLLDIMMPGIGGLETCRNIKANPQLAHIPIIFLTARAQSEEVVEGFEAGGSDYVTKPFSGRELLARVRTHLELKKAQERLMTANSQLTQANEELSEVNQNQRRFFSIIAHDLRSPFNGLRMFPQMLATRFDQMNREDIISIAEDVEDHVESVHHFLEELLEWCMVDSGEMRCQIVPLELNEVVDRVLGVAKMAADNKELTLQTALYDPLVVHADPKMMSTILQNLVSNAIKFTPRGGFVRVTGEPTDDGGAVVCVIDNGTGISEQHLGDLFKVEHRTSTRGTEDERGTGFGLSLCKRFLDQQNATIHVESSMGKGTTFKIVLPPPTSSEAN